MKQFPLLITVIILSVLLSSCKTTTVVEDNSSSNSETTQEELPAPEKESVKADSELPVDYDRLRQTFPYDIYSTHLFAYQEYDQGSFLHPDDITAGQIEQYLRSALIHGIPRDITDPTENTILFYNATHHTPTLRIEDFPEIVAFSSSESNEYFSIITKEHIALTAKALYGDDAKIAFSKLEDTKEFPSPFAYDESTGTAYWNMGLNKTGYNPIVVEYTEFEDYYEVEIVRLLWDVGLTNEDGSTRYFENGEFLQEDEAKEACHNLLPRYKVIIKKGEDAVLYFSSCTPVNQAEVDAYYQ